MGNNKHEKKFVDYWTFKNAYDLLIGLIKNAVPESLKIDSINEKTTDTGVTVDGVLLKDGYVHPQSIKPITYYNIIATGILPNEAELLKYGFNHVTVASSSSNGVALPIEVTNQKLYINNYTSEVITIYGNQDGQNIIQDVTNATPTTMSSINLSPGKSVEFVRIGSIWLAVSFNGIANKPLVYKAILTQSGTNVPVETILNKGDNNFFKDLTWSRVNVGMYRIVSSGITNTNTLVLTGVSTPIGLEIGFQITNGEILIAQYKNGVLSDTFDNPIHISIEYYGS